MTVDSGFAATSKASDLEQRTGSRPETPTSLNSGLPTGPLRPETTPQT